MSIKPTWFIKHFTQITVDFLKENDITTIFTDIDNTVVEWDEPNASDALKQWVTQLTQANIAVVLVSNNNERRIQMVANDLQVPYVYPALKPLHKGLQQAQQLTQAQKANIVMIGDQLLTDVLGAGTFGIRTILVQPLKQSDAFKTRINRFFERILLGIIAGPRYKDRWKENVND